MQSAKRKVNKKIKSSQTIKNDERLIFMVYVCEVCGWMYDENDGNTQVFYMQNATAVFCSFGGEPKEVKF